MTDAADLDVTAAATALRRGDFSSKELTQAYLDRIGRYDGAINAFITVLAERALKQAGEADARRQAGRPLSSLDGIPVALKDNIDVAGCETTNGLASGLVADEDAFVVSRLKASGAVILGKLNMHEGALGGTTNNPHHGATHNPWRKNFSPGGSSGGAGAAVAARLCALALGTDTMGSVRLPAHYCGIAGLKATAGLISTRGVTPLSYRYDYVGPLTQTARDMALLLPLLARLDRESPESVAWPDKSWAFGPMLPDLMYWRIGVVDSFAGIPVESGVAAAFERGLEAFREADADIIPIKWPGYDARATRLAGLLICEADGAYALRERLATEPLVFSDELRGMLDFGRRAPAERLVAAERRVVETGHSFRRLFEEVDLVVCPTAPQAAFAHGGAAPLNQAEFTLIGNFSGCPGMSLPMGLTDEGLPVGLQIYAAPFQESRLVAAASAIESLLGPQPRPSLKGMAKKKATSSAG